MITIFFTLMTYGAQPQSFSSSLVVVPRVHEMIELAGNLYRVEDVTHVVESQEIHVRAVR